jgi:hypothetical protein
MLDLVQEPEAKAKMPPAVYCAYHICAPTEKGKDVAILQPMRGKLKMHTLSLLDCKRRSSKHGADRRAPPARHARGRPRPTHQLLGLQH